MVKNARTLGMAALIVAVGIAMMVLTDLKVVGLVIALVGIVGLFLLLRAPSDTAEAFLDKPEAEEAPRKQRSKASTAVVEEEVAETEDSLGTWEDSDTLSWEAEETSGETLTWEAEESSGGSLTWEAEETGGGGGDTWEAEETTSASLSWEAEETDDGFETFESLSFSEDEAEAPAPSSSGLFSVASPIDENVHSDDDIMAASQATELHVEPDEAEGDNSELAKLLAKVQSRLAAYE